MKNSEKMKVVCDGVISIKDLLIENDDCSVARAIFLLGALYIRCNDIEVDLLYEEDGSKNA